MSHDKTQDNATAPVEGTKKDAPGGTPQATDSVADWLAEVKDTCPAQGYLKLGSWVHYLREYPNDDPIGREWRILVYILDMISHSAANGFVDETGTPYIVVNVTRTAKDMGIPRTSFEAALKTLSDHELITRQREQYGTAIYLVDWLSWFE